LPEAAFYQWLFNGEAVLSANNDSLIVNESGSWSAEIRSEAGCLAISDTLITEIIEFPEQPVVFVNPVNGSFFFNPGSGFDWIWLFEGDTIDGTQNLASFFPTEIGNYSVVVSANPACALYSEEEYYTNLGTEVPSDLGFKMYPQPFQEGFLNIESKWIESGGINIQVLDLTGRQVFDQSTNATAGRLSVFIDQQVPGIYLLRMEQGGRNAYQRLIISASAPGSN
jgi:hypothetical protein